MGDIVSIVDEQRDGPTHICKRPECSNLVSRPARGRPPEYCSTGCRLLFNQEKDKLRSEVRRLAQLCAIYDLEQDSPAGQPNLEDAFMHFVHEVEQARAYARRPTPVNPEDALSNIAQRLSDARDRAYDRLQP